jgi:hypothetical protein
MKRPSVLLVIILLAFSSLIALVALRYSIAGRFSQGFLYLESRAGRGARGLGGPGHRHGRQGPVA